MEAGLQDACREVTTFLVIENQQVVVHGGRKKRRERKTCTDGCQDSCLAC